MRRVITAVVPILLAALSIGARRPAPAPAHFSIVLSSKGNLWSAKCEAGCASGWTSASFGCDRICDARVDALGIVTIAPGRPAKDFSFVASRTDSGITATATKGTAWTSLAWGCVPGRACSARITELGVEVLPR